ncbi:MAG: alpha/beta hydrolase, partial [Pseudomonadota bacterium]
MSNPITPADFEAALDPAYRAAEADLPGEALDWSTDRPEDLRKAYDARSRALAGDVAPDVTVSEWRAEGGRLGLAFRPREGACGAILYLHGGGWIVGSPETHAVVCSLLAARTGGSVFSADYRLAPEHRYPAQTEDAVAAVRALLASEAAATVV